MRCQLCQSQPREQHHDHGGGVAMQLALDAMSTIKMVLRSGSTKVRHVRRTIGVSIFWLHEQWVLNKNSWISHVPGAELTADLGTKGLSHETFAKHSSTMGMMEKDAAKDEINTRRDQILGADQRLSRGVRDGAERG